MASSSLFLLIDDIAALLDDVAAMSKIAAKQTAGVLGDDLALNAQLLTGVKADRELSVVWAVAKGSLLNKAILVPVALAISFFIPWLITPLLIIGGLFLCFEGIEKLIHTFFHRQEKEKHHAELVKAVNDESVNLLDYEKNKIRGAIRTDFILSAEIIAITLGVVEKSPLTTQAAVLSTIALAVTIIVYGLVAGIIRLDDWGLALSQAASAGKQKLGALILRIAPVLMKTLSIVGTAAMFMVGGGILVHGIKWLHHLLEPVLHYVEQLPGIGGVLTVIAPTLANALVGIAAGLVVFLGVKAGMKILTAIKN